MCRSLQTRRPAPATKEIKEINEIKEMYEITEINEINQGNQGSPMKSRKSRKPMKSMKSMNLKMLGEFYMYMVLLIDRSWAWLAWVRATLLGF